MNLVYPSNGPLDNTPFSGVFMVVSGQYDKVRCLCCRLFDDRPSVVFSSYANVMRHARAHQKAGHAVTEKDIKRIKKYRRYIDGMTKENRCTHEIPW